MVEKKRNDLICLDIMLLKRSWYIEMLKNNHPDFIEQSEKEVNAFLEAVKPFENGETYDGSSDVWSKIIKNHQFKLSARSS